MRQQPGISAKYRMAPPGFDKREPGLNPNGRAGKWGNAGGKSNRAGRQEVKVIVLPLLIVRLMFDSFRFNGNCNLDASKNSPIWGISDSIGMDGTEMIRCEASLDFSMSMSG
jgi:hypothetical protein